MGIHCGSIFLIVLSFLYLYLAPPLIFRLHNFFCPLKTGYSEFSFKSYSPWFGSYNFQVIFLAVPQLEALLRLIPGAYSAWLRLWGAKIGRGVYWTPLVELIDRPMLNIGDHVVIGHRVAMTCHFIVPRRGESGLKLYMAPIQIGEHSLLGADVRIAPGVTILPNSLLKYNFECWPDKTYSGKEEK
jgi:acetyltransferase-like isoleucine patch superfamily enzyme